MANKNFTKKWKEDLEVLRLLLNKETEYWSTASGKTEGESYWFQAVHSTYAQSANEIYILTQSLDSLESISDEQLGFHVGKVGIGYFLNMINVYEQHMNALVDSNDSLNIMLNTRIDEKIKCLNESWKTDGNRDSKKLKVSLVDGLKRKKQEMAFIRQTLRINGVLDKDDESALEFMWDIRNSMHNNYCSIKDIDFAWSDLKGKKYHFKYNKGEELSHPEGDLMAYTSVADRLVNIHFKTVATLMGTIKS